MAHSQWYYFVKGHAERAKTFGLLENFTEAEWLDLLANSPQECLCCKKPFSEITISADHVIPLACGGTNTIGNIQILCKQCNSQKHAKAIDYRGEIPVAINAVPLKPRKPRSLVEPRSNTPLRLSVALYEYFQEQAKKNKRSVNAEILIALEERQAKIAQQSSEQR